MSKNPKQANKFIQCFYVGPANGGILSITSVIVDMHHRRKILGFIWDW